MTPYLETGNCASMGRGEYLSLLIIMCACGCTKLILGSVLVQIMLSMLGRRTVSNSTQRSYFGFSYCLSKDKPGGL